MDAFEEPLHLMVGDTELTLQPLDRADVALTTAGANLVHRAAMSVLGSRVMSFEAEELSLIRAVALFTDMVCWEESSGRLFMCANLPDSCYCLPIPPEQWRIVTRGQSIH